MTAPVTPKYAERAFELPKLSDLEEQFQVYLKKLDRDIEDLGVNPNFSDGAESLYRDANVLALLALAIGKSEGDSALKPAAPALVAAAVKVGSARNLIEATAAVAEVKAALSVSGDVSTLEWKKTAKLSPLMKKALPSITTEMKRLGRNEKTLARSNNLDKVVGSSATLVVIAIGCRPNVDETLAPTEAQLWEQYCDRLYDAAAKLNHAADAFRAGSGTFDDFSAAYKEVDSTCNTTCHEKFGGSVN